MNSHQQRSGAVPAVQQSPTQLDGVRRSLLLGALAWGSAPLLAQTAKPIKIIVPFPPGGGNDVFARQMAKGLAELRNYSVVVENKPGAGGNLGTEQVVRSSDQSTTLLLGHTGTVSINPALYTQLKFDPQTDLIPIAMFASSALVLVVPSTSSVKTVADLLALAKAQPGGLTFSSSGSGTGGHLTGEWLGKANGVPVRHIPYKGTAPALTDLVGGQVQMMFSVLPPALALIKSGRLRAVAVSSAKRLPSLPGVPTLSESGIPALAGFESTLTYGILAPRHTSPALVSELSAHIVAVAQTPEFQARLEVDGAVPLIGGTADYAALIKRESLKWAEMVKISGATAE